MINQLPIGYITRLYNIWKLKELYLILFLLLFLQPSAFKIELIFIVRIAAALFLSKFTFILYFYAFPIVLAFIMICGLLGRVVFLFC